jgi:hypothetical protein
MNHRSAGNPGRTPRRHRLPPRWLPAAALGTLGPAAAAATLALHPAADATVYEESATTTANGAGAFLLAGRTNQPANSRRRSLLQFDFSTLPAGATLTAVSLRLNLSSVTTADTPLGLHRATSRWSEGTSDPAGNESAGIAATAGDVTWQFASHPTTAWTTPGGDSLPSASATLTVGSTAGFYTWSDPALVTDVLAWAADPATNFGWILRDPESTPQTAKRFASSEHADPSLRPLLTIEFTPIPEPSAASLLVATLGLVWRRKRPARRS